MLNDSRIVCLWATEGPDRQGTNFPQAGKGEEQCNMLKEETMSERFGDPNFEEYSWTDHERFKFMQAGHETSEQGYPDFTGGQLLNVSTEGGDAGGNNRQSETGREKSDTMVGQFVDGFMSKPKDGPKPYDGMTHAERGGRQFGEAFPPGWDSGRDAYERSKEIAKKRWAGETVPHEDLEASKHATDKFLMELIPVPPMLKGGGSLIQKGWKILTK